MAFQSVSVDDKRDIKHSCTNDSVLYARYPLSPPAAQDELAAAAEAMELRCVIAVVRHGDRTPKQKMKMIVTQVHVFLRAPLLAARSRGTSPARAQGPGASVVVRCCGRAACPAARLLCLPCGMAAKDRHGRQARKAITSCASWQGMPASGSQLLPLTQSCRSARDGSGCLLARCPVCGCRKTEADQVITA